MRQEEVGGRREERGGMEGWREEGGREGGRREEGGREEQQKIGDGEEWINNDGHTRNIQLTIK